MAATIFALWLGSFVALSVGAEHRAAREIASEHLGCSPAEIELGGSHQTDDGPSEYELRGCGRRGHVECSNTVSGFPEEYFKVSFVCVFSEAR